jgi:hypothetical protein
MRASRKSDSRGASAEGPAGPVQREPHLAIVNKPKVLESLCHDATIGLTTAFVDPESGPGYLAQWSKKQTQGLVTGIRS